MTQLMVVPIRDKGDAVLIVSLHDGEPLMGYVTTATLEGYFQRPLTGCDAFLLVKCNLQSFETMLATKSKGCERVQGLRCRASEMTLSDMRDKSGCPLSGEARDSRKQHLTIFLMPP